MPFKYADGKEGHMEDCVKFFTGKVSKKTGKKFTKDQAGAYCATIMRSQEKNEKIEEKKIEQPKEEVKTDEKKEEKKEMTSGKFTLSIHQIGNEKHFDIFLEKEGFCEDWAFTPFKAGEKMMLKMGTRCQKRNNTPLEMLAFNGTVPIGKPGATTNFPGIFTKLEEGKYEMLESDGKIRRFKFMGKKLTGIFNMTYDDADLIENYKYRYIFDKVSSKDMMISNMSKQILVLSKLPEKTTEKLQNKEKIKITSELSENSLVPLMISGVALKEGLWNGLYYPYEEIKSRISQLIGKPLLLDHSKTVRDIVGMVKNIILDDTNRQALFEAEVIDETTARKLIGNLADSVSVGVVVDRIKEGNTLMARNHEYQELSIVLVPACADAKIKLVVKPESIN